MEMIDRIERNLWTNEIEI